MRRGVLAAGATALIAMPAVLAFFSGGFFDEPRLIAALVAWAIVLLAVLFAAQPLPSSIPGRVALLALVLLCAWTGLSIAWAPLGDPAQDDFQRAVLYVGYFAAALALLRAARTRSAVVPALAFTAFAIVAYGLSERLFPSLVELDRSASAAGRLEQPFTYWNAAGLSAAVGLVLATATAADLTRPRPLRALLAAAVVPLGLGAYLSFSRGALAALGLGLLVLLVLSPDWRSTLRAAVLLVGASAIAALVASRYSTVKSLEAAHSGDGLVVLATLLVLAAGAAALTTREPRLASRLPAPPMPRRALAVVAVLAVAIGGVLLIAAIEGSPDAESPATGADPSRLGSVDSNRYRYWEVALEGFADNPLAGLGAGGFAVEWLKEPDRPDAARDAHSLYVETGAELGVVGLALLLAFMAAVAFAATRWWRTDPRAAAAPAAALAAWTLHAGLDWDWEMPGVTLTAFLLAAAIVAGSEEEPAGD
jgi:hypothetical protein